MESQSVVSAISAFAGGANESERLSCAESRHGTVGLPRQLYGFPGVPPRR